MSEIKFHRGDLKVVYKHGNIFVYKNNQQIDKFSPKDYEDKKTFNKDSLKKIAAKRFQEVDDYRSPNGKDVTATSGIQNPQVKIFKLGGKYRVFDENGNEIKGSSSHNFEKIVESAQKLNDNITKNKTLKEDEKADADAIATAKDLTDQKIGTLSDVLEDAQTKKEIEDTIKMAEFTQPQPSPIESPPEEEAPEGKGIFDTIIDSISEMIPKSQETPAEGAESQPPTPKNRIDQLIEAFKNGKINANQFRQLENKFRGEESSTAFQKDLRDKQGARRQTLDRFDERLEGNEKLVDRLEGYREGVSEELKDLKGIGKEESERMRGLMPGDDFKLDWGVKPTFENSRDIWNNEFAPNYKFSSDKPFNQREHELALSGHAGGSALEGNQRKKMGARSREELENMGMIQDMLLKQQGARGIDISDVQTLGKGRANAYQQGLDAESRIMNPLFDNEQRARERGDDLSRTRAEADTSLTNSELQEDSNLYDFLEQQRINDLQDLEKQGNLGFEEKWAKIAINEASELANNKLRADQAGIWVNRNQTYDMLERTGIAREEIMRLQQAEKNPNEWASLIASIMQTAGTVAGAYFGGPAGAAAGGKIGKKAGEVVSRSTGNQKETYSGWGERGSPFRGER